MKAKQVDIIVQDSIKNLSEKRRLDEIGEPILAAIKEAQPVFYKNFRLGIKKPSLSKTYTGNIELYIAMRPYLNDYISAYGGRAKYGVRILDDSEDISKYMSDMLGSLGKGYAVAYLAPLIHTLYDHCPEIIKKYLPKIYEALDRNRAIRSFSRKEAIEKLRETENPIPKENIIEVNQTRSIARNGRCPASEFEAGTASENLITVDNFKPSQESDNRNVFYELDISAGEECVAHKNIGITIILKMKEIVIRILCEGGTFRNRFSHKYEGVSGNLGWNKNSGWWVLIANNSSNSGMIDTDGCFIGEQTVGRAIFEAECSEKRETEFSGKIYFDSFKMHVDAELEDLSSLNDQPEDIAAAKRIMLQQLIAERAGWDGRLLNVAKFHSKVIE